MATIGIDYTPAYEQGAGIGRYVRDLVSALTHSGTQNQYKLLVAGLQADRPLVPEYNPNFQWRPTRLTPVFLARMWHRLRVPLPVNWFTGQIDLFHATDFVLPPLTSSTRSILTVHDLSFVRVPETATPSLKRYLDDVVPRSVRRADHILADSQATKDDLIELYGTPSNKITVLLSGVDERFKPSTRPRDHLRDRYNLPDGDYIFSIGTVQPRKNYERLVTALARLRERGYEIQLVIAGAKGWLDTPIYDTVHRLGVSDAVHFLGFVADEDLPDLYTHATAFAFPSLYEGFGFPVLESMACGTPVLTSNVSSLPEVAGKSALTVDPYDIEAITDGLERLLSDSALRQHCIEEGFRHVQRFNWAQSAQLLLRVYQDVLT